MRPGFRTRATGALLAALFLGGVGGASDLDAFLFHREPTPVSAGVAHVEGAAAANCHADRCVLGLRVASSRVSPQVDLLIRFEGIPQHDVAAPSVAAPHTPAAASQRQSRAPPSSIA